MNQPATTPPPNDGSDDTDNDASGGVVPSDLVRWFAGHPIAAERHGLPRIESRWRVIEVTALLGDTDNPYVTKGEWREFKTKEGAEAYRDRLARQGVTVLIQPGFTFWPDPHEWNTSPH